MLVDQSAHVRIGIGLVVHDMAPVTPHRLQVQQHETLLASGLNKGGAIIVLPFQIGVGGTEPAGLKQQQTSQQQAMHRQTPSMLWLRQ